MITLAFSFAVILFIIGLLSNHLLSCIFIIKKVFGKILEIYIVQGEGNLINKHFFHRILVLSINIIVTWSNNNYMEHTITTDDAEAHWFDSVRISPCDTFENIFDSLGIYGYHCTIHLFMKGIVLVE
ncbi:MAG TPA: hypothetical protein VFK40_08915 [Nitrososphaeraceae archaeon]|nr:hypothetical protein [Nitrososphaeraceae archaeon]